MWLHSRSRQSASFQIEGQPDVPVRQFVVRPSNFRSSTAIQPGAKLLIQPCHLASVVAFLSQKISLITDPDLRFKLCLPCLLVVRMTNMAPDWKERGSKRKASDQIDPRSSFGVGEFLNNRDHNTTTNYGFRRPSLGRDSDSGSMDSDGGGWSVVESRSAKHKRRKIDNPEKPKKPEKPEEQLGDYPSISFYKSRPERVDLKALQDLVFYALADGAAPTWMAIKNAKQIQQAVVLMVPGLDRETLRDEELWNSVSDDSQPKDPGADQTLSRPPDENVRDQQQASSERSAMKSPSHLDPDTDTMASVPPRDRLLEHILQVRAPGDSSQSRIHSPLQHMLVAPFPPVQKTKNGKADNKVQAVRTPIADFVHSADELRDAEYPIHPAAFENSDDARLEQERREKTGQSVSDGWVDTDVTVSMPQKLHSSPGNTRDPVVNGLKPYALDCEMVLTTDDKYSLARISLVDWTGAIILDEYVKPLLPIKNYFTEFSGITEEILKDVTTSLEQVQKKLLSILKQHSILLGHSLESDLNALKLTHPFVVDTSIIYPHPRGLPLRSSLKFLANRYLKREIQKGGLQGHDSVEDARAVLDLVKLKCERGPRWGTSDANGESIFRRIGSTQKADEHGPEDASKTSAIVEYGTPERGLGKEATYHIACETDEEILRGILRAACGDPIVADAESDGNIAERDMPNTSAQVDQNAQSRKQAIPPHGVDFIWSRLHDLEAIQGWNALPSDDTRTPSSPPSTSEQPSEDPLKTAKIQTLRRILHLYTSLPPKTLFIVYSGTSDLRPLLRLQAMQRQYKREFKVKKWDELTVKWTDTEEQAMKKACESARRGVGILAVTRSLEQAS